MTYESSYYVFLEFLRILSPLRPLHYAKALFQPRPPDLPPPRAQLKKEGPKIVDQDKLDINDLIEKMLGPQPRSWPHHKENSKSNSKTKKENKKNTKHGFSGDFDCVKSKTSRTPSLRRSTLQRGRRSRM